MWVILRERDGWCVGFYGQDGFVGHALFGNERDAEMKCHYLNGGN